MISQLIMLERVHVIVDKKDYPVLSFQIEKYILKGTEQ